MFLMIYDNIILLSYSYDGVTFYLHIMRGCSLNLDFVLQWTAEISK